METTILPTNLHVQGDITTSGNLPEYPRSRIQQDTFASFPVKLTDFRVWDQFHTVLPGTSATDDLGLYGGTWASASPAIKTYDVKTVGATALYARVLMQLPECYDAGQSVKIRAKAGMVTTVADVSCTLDFVVYESDKFAGIGSDLCATAAQSINSLTQADYDFSLTTSGLVAGDILDVRMHVAVNDAASATAVIAQIGAVELLCDIRG